MLKQTFTTLFASSLALVLVAPVSPAAGASNQVQKSEMAGYVLIPNPPKHKTASSLRSSARLAASAQPRTSSPCFTSPPGISTYLLPIENSEEP